jgi:xanthine dehydrogenase YagR molybdenum-binding subunit
MTHQNMPRIGTVPLVSMSDLSAVGTSGLSIMQDPEIRYNGQIIAAVVAETQEQADHAASLINCTYVESSPKTSFEDAKASARTPASILVEKNHVSIGNAEQALAQSAYQVDAVYRTPPLNHNAIELHGVTLAWDGDELLVHDATQMVTGTAGALAKVFSLKKGQVRVLSPFVGGGFGAKGLWDYQIVAAAAARIVDRPVRLVLSREGVYRIVGGRSPSEQRVAIGADPKGNFTALVHTGYSVMPDYAACPEQFTFSSRGAYQSKTFEIVQHHLDLDIVPNTFMRAPGEASGSFAVESAVDDLAHAMGVDPVELRLQNMPTKHPISGQQFSQHGMAQALVDGAERFGWSKRQPQPGAQSTGEWQVGMGCAVGSLPYARMPAKVRLTLRSDATVEVASAAQEMGMGVATIQAQQASDRLAVPVDSVEVLLGDSSLPNVGGASGSTQTASHAAAIAAGADRLAVELLRLVQSDSPLAGLKAGSVQFIDEGLGSIADPFRHETFKSILTRADRDEMVVETSGPLPLEFLKYAMHSSSANFCELRVSTVTGEVRVDRLLGSFDCGNILNPKTATSQFKGAMIMGLGMALTEETLFDERTGRIMNASLADYHVPSHLDVPDIEVMWTGIPDPRSPLGARGIGEIGVTGVVAAIANAVFNATGRRVNELPITLDKLL